MAFRVVSGFITGYSQAELVGPLSVARDENLTTITDRIAALPSEQFPKLIEIALAAVSSDPAAEFRAGVRIILTGLRA